VAVDSRGNVIVTYERFRLTSPGLVLKRTPRGIEVRGPGEVVFCPCPNPPVSVGFEAGVVVTKMSSVRALRAKHGSLKGLIDLVLFRDKTVKTVAILGENEFAADLVFSDVIMPGMNGVALAGVIRERFPGLPVVLTSGYSNVLAENAHRGFELIQKPYSVEALSRILRKAISDARL
jgi:CheY-like chemotaxis protein